jgi:RNA polymerase sigma-70 factor, ECF subfamily
MPTNLNMPIPTLADHDDDLALRTADGDVEAFKALYSRHNAQVFRVALRVSGRQAAAEEATQDTFLSLWRTARSFDPKRGTLKAWLLCAARNRSIDGIRREARHSRTVEIDDVIANQREATDRTDDEVIRRDEASTARDLLAALPREQRQVIELGFFGGLSQVEIAKAVGIPLGTVKGRQRLALQRMHLQLQAAL